MLGFPLPYRDELLYSTIARHGVHSGIISPKELLQDVYGDTRVIATSDLPGHLNSIAALYPEKAGIAPCDLLYHNTLFPLYALFMGETRRKALIRELTTDEKISLVQQMQAKFREVAPSSSDNVPGWQVIRESRDTR